MEIFREVIAWLVAGIGVVGWTIFLPQIKLLIRVKTADSISLLLIWGSFAMQVIVLIHILIQEEIDWKLSIIYFTSIACHTVILALIYYYRRWPGGKNQTSPEGAP